MFDSKAEARLRRKIDLYIVPTVVLIYLFCFIDRANIGNARLAGLEEDLSMSGYDYNTVLLVFYISYIIFEIPLNIACKWLGPGWFLPGITVAFGLCSVFTAFVHTTASAAGVRFVELAFWLSLYLVMAPLAGTFGGLLASGILTFDSFGGLKTWRMIFALEGIITVSVGLIAFVTLTDRLETARWLSAEEKDLATARLCSENEYAGHEVLDKLDKTKLMRGIFNPVTIATSFIMLFTCVTKTSIEQQLQTVPPNIIGAFSTLLIPYLSSPFDRPVNVVSDIARASLIGTVVMMGNIGGLVATWSFLPFDGLTYPIRNGLNLATGASILVISVCMLLWSRLDNKRRDTVDEARVLDGLSAREIEDLDWRHPSFRWRQ
ncbi:major facilitator superfamily domain-containing protein [Aspergillus spectabilis]